MRTFADDVDWWYQHGYVQTRVDPAEVADNSFVDQALTRLGPYPHR